MDDRELLPTYRRRARGITPRNAALLAPLGVAVGWVVADSWRGRLNVWTLVLSGLVGAIGLVGLIYALAPAELIADSDGLRWNLLMSRRSIPWSEIEEIDVGISKAVDGYDARSVRLLTGRNIRSRALTIGINLFAARENAAGTAYRRGFTGFDINLANAFAEPTQQIVAELQMRLERSRRSASV